MRAFAAQKLAFQSSNHSSDHSSGHLVFFWFVSLLLVSLFVSGCANDGYSGRRNINSNNGQDTPNDPEAAAGTAFLGTRSFEQLYATFQNLTGLEAARFESVRTYYRDNRNTLPLINSAGGLSASQMLAVTNFAFRFCNILMREPAEMIRFFTPLEAGEAPVVALNGEGNLTENHSTAFGESGKRQRIAQHFIRKFWVRASNDPFKYRAYEDEISNLIETLRLGETNNTTATRNVLAAICTTTLASGAVTLY